MKKIKYTPDAADKLRALRTTISGEYGADKAKKIMGQSFFLWGNDPVHAHYILKVA